jgi:hypothetical protein
MKTKNVKTNTLNSKALDWAVATQKGLPIKHDPMGFKTGSQAGFWVWEDVLYGKILLIGDNYSPSTDWAEGGAIIESEGISLIKHDKWIAKTPNGVEVEGKTALIAAIRAFVVTNLGEEIEVPEQLL